MTPLARAATAILTTATLATAAGPAQAATAMPIDIAPGPLGDVLVALGGQAGITVGLTDPSLAALPSPGARGRLSAAAALGRLLSGLPAQAVRIDAGTFQIRRRAPSLRPAHRLEATPHSSAPPSPEIIVTGSKRAAPMQAYAGSVAEIDAGALRPNRQIHGSEALVDALPVLSSTHLGPGRNKLFIRGIADSSFNGPSQSTVGEYLGDVRLNYSAPDPDLAMIDIHAVEVLEGPQGTLYGAGSLGGVIRLVPNPPDLQTASLSLSGGGSLTAHGAGGWDAAAIGNLPLVPGRLALRATVYGARDGGYIDDVSRGLKDINSTRTRGGRATLRFTPANDWTIDLGGVVQNIDSADGQYAERGLPPLERASRIAQPFDNDYALASLVVRHAMGWAELVSATSGVFHDVGSTYDATGTSAVPLRYHEDHHIQLLTNETRLSHQGSGGGWVLGVELLRSADRLTRTLGPLGAEGTISGTSNVVEQASLFGEATIRLAPRWFVTGGGRVSTTRLVGDALGLPAGVDDDHTRHATYVLPSVGLLWKAGRSLAFYARYQEGVRPGGLSVQLATTQRFEADSLATWEAGLRFGDPARALSGSAALSYAHWEDIQADLVDAAGLPYTANLGSGRILGAEARIAWKPGPALSIDAALFANDSRLDHPEPAFAGEADASLPNIADLTGHLGIRYAATIAGRTVDLSGALTYVGKSRLGVGTMLDLHQGRYLDTALGASTRIGRATVSIDASNLLDARRNIFALGNPFGIAAGNQITPLRPRTVRLGLQIGF